MYTLKNLRFFLTSFILFYSMFLTLNVTALSLKNALTGMAVGLFILLVCFFSEKSFSRSKLLRFNATILGLLVGLLFGISFNLIFDHLIPNELNSSTIVLFVRPSFILIGIYLGTILTVKNAEQIYFSIPFIRLNHQKNNTKSLLLSSSALSDPRVIDLFSSGIIDRIIVPKFVIEDIQKLEADEIKELPNRKVLGVYRKLQSIPDLEIELSDLNFPDMSEDEKLLRIAKVTDSNILTADTCNTKEKSLGNLKIINIHSLSNALKPLMVTGERLQITIQRYGKEPRHGKEPRQGVGYLEDGAMVVVNGGGDFIGEKIDATVLSVKHTSSGRIIFCNAVEKNPTEASYST